MISGGTRGTLRDAQAWNRLNAATWEHKQARLGAGLGLLAAVAGAGLVFTLANVLADNGLSPFGPSQQVVSSVPASIPFAGSAR